MKLPKFKLPTLNAVSIISLAATAVSAGATILSAIADDKKLDARVAEKVSEAFANRK